MHRKLCWGQRSHPTTRNHPLEVVPRSRIGESSLIAHCRPGATAFTTIRQFPFACVVSCNTVHNTGLPREVTNGLWEYSPLRAPSGLGATCPSRERRRAAGRARAGRSARPGAGLRAPSVSHSECLIVPLAPPRTGGRSHRYWLAGGCPGVCAPSQPPVHCKSQCSASVPINEIIDRDTC